MSMCLSTVIIAPPGTAKTSTLNDLERIFPKTMVIFRGLVTEYHIAKMNKEDLNNKVWCVNDIVDLTKTMAKRRVAGVLTFFKNIIDGHAEILVAQADIKLKGKVGILVNIPRVAFDKKRGEWVSTTFLDRVIPFNYDMNWDNWKEKYIENELMPIDIKPIKLKPGSIELPKKFNRKVVECADSMATVKISGLPRNIQLVRAFLTGNAMLNGRKCVEEADFEIWDKLKSHFRW